MVGCSYDLAITVEKIVPEARAWSTICLNNFHTRHLLCITKIMILALPAARRVSREGDNVEATVVKMHQSRDTP